MIFKGHQMGMPVGAAIAVVASLVIITKSVIQKEEPTNSLPINKDNEVGAIIRREVGLLGCLAIIFGFFVLYGDMKDRVSKHVSKEENEIKNQMEQRKKKMQENIKLHENIIRKFVSIISLLEDLIKDMQTHKTAVRISKGVGAFTGTVGAILCFTPLAPVGMGIGIASGVAGIGTAGGDWYKTSKARKKIEEHMEEAKIELENLEREVKELQKSLKTLGDILGGVGNLKNAAAAGNLIVKGVLTLGDDIAVGATAGSAMFRGALAAGDDVAVAAFNTTRVVGNVLGAVGAGLGVIDAVYTAFKENPSIELAQTLMLDLKEKITTMEENIKEMEENIKEMEENIYKL